MKKIISAVSLVVLMAVTAKAQLTIGPYMGINNTTYRFSNSNQPKGILVIDGRLGALCNLPLKNKWHFQSSILVASSSQKINSSVSGKFHKTVIGSVRLPLNIVLKSPMSKRNVFVFGLGPYFDLNVYGKAVFPMNDNIGNYVGMAEYKIPMLNKNRGISRCGLGANAFVGFEAKKGFSFRVFGEKQFTNLYPTTYKWSASSRFTTYAYGLACSYLFPLKKQKTHQAEKSASNP